MATIYTINDDVAALKTALGAAVTAGYFASVADHETDNTVDGVICKDSDSNAVLTLYRVSTRNGYKWVYVFRLNDGTTFSDQYGGDASGSQTPLWAKLNRMFVCSGGAYLEFVTTTNTNGKYGGIIISKTNRNKTGAIFASMPWATGKDASYKGNCRSLAVDDSAELAVNHFNFGGQNTSNQTQITNVPTSANADAISYFDKVKYILTCQYNYVDNQTTPPVNFTHSGKRFLWVGSFAILDEEATS